MIVDLPNTSTAAVSKRLVKLRADTGAMALSRVLTLLVVVDEADAEEAIEVANDASRQHPCRIIVVVAGNRRGAARLDGQIRVGGDAGASEVVVLRLYGPLAKHGRAVVTPLLLADSPIVAWWPAEAPKDPAADPVGAIAQRRITDAARSTGTPRSVLKRLASAYTPGDTDLAWSRVTLWRGLLAAALDQAPYEPVTAAMVVAAPDSPSGELLGGWLAARLRCPVSLARSRTGSGIISVRLERASGTVDLVRPLDGNTSVLRQPGQPDRTLALPHRSDAECLADELRRLDPDEVYEDALRKGFAAVSTSRRTAGEAVRDGAAPSPAEAERTAQRLRRAARMAGSSAMVDKMPMPADTADSEAVRKAAATKLAEVKERRS
ncbi:glucose-6-phosphate dehydrogenase assembly protein OpcA [Phycicoccus sonneratiae]|uniref:Glucose-6-phosphate dehydrogenase assembly protein OpcA n=1 Tax=Phycicoccus sonneratiae TaxID=2807628 RepID=A0ABS2CKD3_9MICO|nr:glucose-6-phosphate dehydrogenase assembly protein OpcA [Phycicoccus sonneraticus]MBM6399534.1 glucose-6-phosphate dehydrogenase assembly protein OpcA [Phycicoccus sonneraticus]